LKAYVSGEKAGQNLPWYAGIVEIDNSNEDQENDKDDDLYHHLDDSQRDHDDDECQEPENGI